MPAAEQPAVATPAGIQLSGSFRGWGGFQAGGARAAAGSGSTAGGIVG